MMFYLMNLDMKMTVVVDKISFGVTKLKEKKSVAKVRTLNDVHSRQ